MTGPRDVAGTRRDLPGPVAGETRHDVPLPSQTRRDAPDGPGRTRRDGGPELIVPDAPGLPAEVAARYRTQEMLARQGAEGDVYRVLDPDDGEWVLKIYHRDIAPDPQVWEALRRTSSRHLVSVRETGATPAGRKFEVMEYLTGGDLREFAAHGPLDPATLRAVVRQLTDGLAELHAARIIHRDLKPENILLRARSPLDLVLTDFGLSRRLDQTSAFSTAARTLLYTAPETFGNHISPARDWWSLGMIVRELAMGERPFAGLSEEVIISHLISRPIDLSAVTDERVALLCRGLLVRDPAERWNAEQVRRWLDGESPDVAAGAAGPVADAAVPGFRQWGVEHVTPTSLAAALAQRWEDAARMFFALSTSERWKALKAWLAHFDDTPFYAGEARQELCDELDGGSLTPDAKLARLLVLLGPSLDPAYREVRLRPEDLPDVAARSTAGDVDCAAAVDVLWRAQLLPVLAGHAEAGELTAVDIRWRARFAAFEAATGSILVTHPHLGPVLTGPDTRRWALGMTLAAAAGRGNAEAAVDASLDRFRASLPRRVEWFEGLLSWRDAGDPARALAVLAVAPAATEHAEREALQEQQHTAALQARRQEWHRVEQARLDGRGNAVGYAAGGAAVVFGLWLVFLVIGGSSAAAGAFVALFLQAGIECGLAYGIGGDYHPRFSLLRGSGQAAGGVGSFLRERPGVGCLGAIGVLILLPILTFSAPWVVPVVVVAGHGAWALVRWNRWTSQHNAHRLAVLGPAA